MQLQYELFLLLSSTLLFLIDFILLSRKTSDKGKNWFGFVATALGFGIVVTSYVLLLLDFVVNNFQVASVYSHSSTMSSLLSKVYASWAGAGGSMLFLTVLLSIVYFVLRVQVFRKTERFNIDVTRIFVFVLIVFIIVCSIRNPFESFNATPPEGLGLNPQLQSVWMVIHPPIVFSAYAFIVLAYVLALSCIKNNKDLDDSKLFTICTYSGWLLLTLGIALGGVWAYEVLGWGGYWAWDPVETASLLPWLFLTAYFFMKGISKSRQGLTREFMIMITFASLIFLSALTRGGFTQSVHSYAVSAVGPIMLVFALTMILYFFHLKRARRIPLFKLDVNKSSLTERSFYLGFWSLIMIAIVCLVGIAFADFPYSYWTFPFVFIFVLSLVGFSLDEQTHYVRVIVLTLLTLAVGGAASLILPLGVNLLTTITVPSLIAAFLLLLRKNYKLIREKRQRLLGRSFLGLAIVVLLLGVFISAGVKTTITVDGKANTPIAADQIVIEFTNLTIINSSSRIYNEEAIAIIPEFSTVQTDLTIKLNQRSYMGMLSASFYPNYGVIVKPFIVTTETGDLYLHLDSSESLFKVLIGSYSGNITIPEELSITVQYNPMVYLVWIGVALMLVSITIQFATELSKKKQKI